MFSVALSNAQETDFAKGAMSFVTLPATASHSWITTGVFVKIPAKSIGALTYPPVPKIRLGRYLTI